MVVFLLSAVTVTFVFNVSVSRGVELVPRSFSRREASSGLIVVSVCVVEF
jgi:hypothetical protein